MVDDGDDDDDDDDDLLRFLLILATSHAALGGSWVLENESPRANESLAIYGAI